MAGSECPIKAIIKQINHPNYLYAAINYLLRPILLLGQLNQNFSTAVLFGVRARWIVYFREEAVGFVTPQARGVVPRLPNVFLFAEKLTEINDFGKRQVLRNASHISAR